jgi:type I restriction enzyme M protein
MPKDTNYPTRRRGQSKDKVKSSGATLGFEEKLWLTADKLRGHMDAAEDKHVVLGLVFLKYISDAFAERHTWLLREAADPKSDYYVKQERGCYEVAEERDEYAAENIFWVPRQARWDYLQDRAKQPTIGKLIDDAMLTIEKENPSLKGVLAKDYARPTLDKQRLSAPIRSGWALRNRRLRICPRAVFAAH